MPAPAPKDEAIYNTVAEIYRDIPDPNMVTVRMLRERTAEKLGLDKEGLDDKKDLVTELVKSIIDDEPPPNFVNGDIVVEPLVAEVVPMTWQRALAATSGLILRKLPKPSLSPFKAPTVDLGDLTVRDFNRRNPVKAVVDIILNHRVDIDTEQVKKSVIEGDMENLPDILKPPPGAIPVNHFTQSTMISLGDGLWHIVKFITFQSDSENGKVKGDTAATYQSGTPTNDWAHFESWCLR